jgi:hypothetical protein
MFSNEWCYGSSEKQQSFHAGISKRGFSGEMGFDLGLESEEDLLETKQKDLSMHIGMFE